MASRKEYEMLFKLNAQLGSSYTGTFTKAQQQLIGMQKEIEALSKRQSDITAYQKQQSAVEATQKKLEVLQQQYDNIQKEMSETGNYSSDLANKMLAKQQQIDKTNDSLTTQEQKLGQMSAALRDAGVDTGNLGKASADLSSEIEKLKQNQEAAAEKANNFGASSVQAFQAIQQAIVAAGIAKALKEIYEWFADCAGAAMDYEQVMAGVRRTVGGTDQVLAAISAEFKEMSVEMPITTSELGKIAETAGQLGIAQAYVTEFTEVMAMLGTTTDLTADNAATMLAQFANITGLDPKDYARLGATVADLGDATATTASKVVDMSQGLAAAASIAGMSETDILGISAAVGSLGIEAQAGSTAMSTLIQTLYKAVETGKGLEDFAAVSNMSAREFKTAWGEDAVGAMDAFIQGLNDTERNGRSAVVILDELGITNVRQTKAILGLAQAGDLLSNTVRQGNKAWEENTALQAKADIMYSTTQSQLVMMQNAYNNLKVAIGDNYTPELQKLYSIGTGVLKGVTEFVEKNPALVKSVTAAAGVFIVATTAVIGLNAAVKVFNALKMASLLPAGPIMAAITGVALLTAGIVALTSASNEAVPSVAELTEAARGMSKAMDEATATYDKTISSTLAAANVAETYIGKLEAMEAAGITTDEQAQQYHNTLALLCQVVPELADHIDLETDTINGGTAALLANTEAWKENAKQQAYQEQLNSLYASYSAVLIEAEKNSIELTEAQYALEQAEQNHSDALARMTGLWEEARQTAGAFAKENGFAADTTAYLSQEYYDLQNSISTLNDEVWVAYRTVDTYTKAIEEGGEATAEAEEKIALTEKAVKNLMGATEEETEAAKEAARVQRELQSEIGNVTIQVEELAAAYKEAYEAAFSSVQGQYALWDQAASVVATSASSINSALESQIGYWQDYNANLSGLTERSADIEGLSEMIASFADGSKDSVNAVAGMASATDEQLAAMVANWQALQQEQELVAGSLADLETDFTATMDALQHELETSIAEMNLNEEAAESGRDTIQGFIDSAEDMLPAVQAAYARVGQAAMDAIDAKLDIHSPSREMEWRAEMTWAGYINKTKAMEPEVAAAMAEAANTGTDAFAAEEAQFVMFTPQFMAALSAMSAGTNAVAAESYGGGPGIYITIASEYQISGSETPAQLEAIFSANNENLRELIIDVLESEGVDVARRAYR